MGLTALISMVIIAIVSLNENKDKDDAKSIKLEKGIFITSPIFNIGSFALLIVLSGLYAFFW
jgi:SSS family solute:Na+ symporter